MAHWRRLARAGADFCVWLFIYIFIYYELWPTGEGWLGLVLISVCGFLYIFITNYGSLVQAG